jgi:hypothetical protein
MFVYIVDRNSTFLPKAYQPISVPFAFQLHLISETEKKNLSGVTQSPHTFSRYTFISSHGKLFTQFFTFHSDRYQQSFYSGPVCNGFYSFLSFFRQKNLMIYIVTEKIREVLQKDSSNEEEIFDSDEDEVQESDLNTETSESDSETEADHIDVSDCEEEVDSRRSQSIYMQKIMKQCGKKMCPLIMFALEL